MERTMVSVDEVGIYYF